MTVEAYAPGRVNLIGDHTDYTGGLALPMAIDLGTTVRGRRGGDRVRLRSTALPGEATVAVGAASESDTDDEAHRVVEHHEGAPHGWAAYVAAVVHEVRPSTGFEGDVTSTLPVGAGLSSSAALEVAVALAIGATGTPLEIARRCQRAETRASGVPCGIMDQLASLAGVEGHALLMDFTLLTVDPVPVPDRALVIVVHSGQARALAGSAYADRRGECERAAARLGPLREADGAAVARLADPTLRRRARHVVSENRRVTSFADALADGDLVGAGRLMDESHASLRDDFDVSTPRLDAVADELRSLPGVHGARLTGAGFGGCVVAIADATAFDRDALADRSWIVRPSAGARAVGTSP